MERPNFTTYFRHLLHKKSNFCHLENGKIRFYSKKNYNFYANVVHNGNTHGCAKFGHVIMNYAMDVAMTMGRCIEIHKSS
jgi:hypothetical protein